MLSQMEHVMESMMLTFRKFAGDKSYLTKEDLRVLMEKEFPGFLENQKDLLAIDKIMKDLDQCQDSRVGFQSFFTLIAVTITCSSFVVHKKQKGRKEAVTSILIRVFPMGHLMKMCPTACPCIKIT
ncbi:LOW QUALITY PROTEIN: protein S100-A10-like [Molossus nigricans]